VEPSTSCAIRGLSDRYKPLIAIERGKLSAADIHAITKQAPIYLSPVNIADPGPIYLQNHGNPVRYRNIWVVRK
jgi:hypothetical protein